MPRHKKAMKDVVSCDKLREAAKLALRPGDFRMGQPAGGNAPASCTEYIGAGGERGEVKHLSTLRKRKKYRFPK